MAKFAVPKMVQDQFDPLDIPVEKSPNPESAIDRHSRTERPDSECRRDRFGSIDRDTHLEDKRSFELWNANVTRSIDSIVLSTGDHKVRDFLASPARPSPSGLAFLIGEGIRFEGKRCLHKAADAANGLSMYQELRKCSDIHSILVKCVDLYTRETFLYRSVNKYMRDSPNGDQETGRNLGLYIGVLRECFCVRSGLNPLEWCLPPKLYRGTDFPFEVVIDYARRRGEHIWWQGFTSASADIAVARKFRGNVLFEILVGCLTPLPSRLSDFPAEQDFVLNPYQRFKLNTVEWNSTLGRWIIQVLGEPSPDTVTWFP
jgi:hypothetical protein